MIGFRHKSLVPLGKFSLQRVRRPKLPFRARLGTPALSLQPLHTEPVILGAAGTLVVSLATCPAEVTAAQDLRFRVFESMKTGSAPVTGGLDRDRFDAYCDHLLVLDQSVDGPLSSQLVGTYRLLSPESAERAGRFYTADEFDLPSLLSRHPERRFLELGRSCVLPAYRTKRTIDLLWQGIWAYCLSHRIDTMVGCASFPGTAPAAHAEALSFLAHHAAAERDFICPAQPGRGVPTDMMPAEAVDMKSALGAMPPLVKGYLRLGAMFGHEAVVDKDFGTVDVLTILPVERIASRYLTHFTPKAKQAAEALAA
ncbi:GNAT family N-acetyltransferase [Notoacmeibacter ruber]|uniref:L-ornithine N(alpha)-acyltransferase n=2 Tax=Notoacmeibacter ruber TaxID=2670375 RepID=A0A3L7JF34_9HYPH|nr:GNAT family N-acetyltransferase [Notoacmeibacter ruber]